MMVQKQTKTVSRRLMGLHAFLKSSAMRFRKTEKKPLSPLQSAPATISRDGRLWHGSNRSSRKYNEVIKSHFTAISETPIHADHKIVTENQSVCVKGRGRGEKTRGVEYP